MRRRRWQESLVTVVPKHFLLEVRIHPGKRRGHPVGLPRRRALSGFVPHLVSFYRERLNTTPSVRAYSTLGIGIESLVIIEASVSNGTTPILRAEAARDPGRVPCSRAE